MKQPLPSGPSSLCFNKEDFMKDDFNVEMFVVECRRRVPLDNLRDDLSVYLKVLQSAMIELINKDYADFVNLSTNLVGMDKAINNLMSPLNQLRTEVLNVRNAMDEAVLAIEEKMKQKSEIRNNKACLLRLIKIIQCVEKMESLLGISSGNKNDLESAYQYQTREISGQLIERVATEFNKLQFFVNKSRGLPLVEEIRPRVMNITTTLQYSLEGSFKEGLETNNIEVLRQCLRTYATIDKMRDAENLFRQHIVKPHLEEIINEHSLSTYPHGLSGMYSAILDFIPKHCKILKEVTSGKGQGGGEVVRGYDFLVNSIWPEVVSSIENRAHSIFAPGNPTVFHEKYLCSMQFVETFEIQCGSQASVRRLRSHPSYSTFMSKWSLPVYFQIRFQEIAGAFETALTTPFIVAADKTLFHLHASYTLWQCMHQCWQSKIYLQPLCHRFWKLNLQLLSRYSTWLMEVYETEINGTESKQSLTISTVEANAMSKSTNGTEVSSIPVSETADPSPPPPPPITMAQIVCLISDVQMLSVMLSDFYAEDIIPLVKNLGLRNTNFLEESLQESVDALNKQLPKFGEYVINEITKHASTSLKTVNDIPRLYRRTNREVPSKPSVYVSGVMKPIKTFLSEHESVIGEDNRKEWLTAILQNLCEVYLATTNDVLTSVKKMEESLKRLKKAKSTTALSSQQGHGLSDDDKIRLQLFLDVTEFGKQIDALSIEKDDVEAFGKLYYLVEAAKSGSAM